MTYRVDFVRDEEPSREILADALCFDNGFFHFYRDNASSAVAIFNAMLVKAITEVKG